MKALNILLIFFFTQCSNQQDFYHGYVYDEQTNKPLKNVFVKENIKSNPKSTYTNFNGYFKIGNKENSISDLVFSIKGYGKDTVVTMWTQHGEQLKYKFLNSLPDTLFLKNEN